MNANKKIAKNTILLYCRTAVTMLVSLYTSRVILDQLGVADYGVYNVIGGFVIMFNALAAPLGGATQRFITYAIGTKDLDHVRTVFSASVYIHLILAFLTILVIELIGGWYIECKMNIPHDRLWAAFLVFHSSVITLFSRIVTVPYSAAVVAYEKFGFYAWNSIVLAVFRLLLISLLPMFPADKLITYSLMEMFANVILNISFIWYCLKSLQGCELVKLKEKKILKNIIGFSGWNFLGTSSNIVYTQGSSVLLNFFYGVLLNAALGVTQQVLSAVNSFVSNFMMAVNPQITKSYAMGDYQRSNTLVFVGSKIASFLLLIIGFPIVANIHYLLDLWLVEVPKYTEMFVVLAILSSFLASFTNPFNCLIFATGDIKAYQISCVIINVTSVFILYSLFSLQIHPAVLYLILVLQAILKLCVLMRLARRWTNFPVLKYMRDIYGKSILFLIPIAVVIFLKKQYIYDMSFVSFLIESLFYITLMAIFIYCFGLDKEEKLKIIELVKNKLKKHSTI